MKMDLDTIKSSFEKRLVDLEKYIYLKGLGVPPSNESNSDNEFDSKDDDHGKLSKGEFHRMRS